MYSHLNKEQRLELGFLVREGYSLRGAARVLRVSHSTLSRELKRNGSARAKVGYHASDAQRKVRRRKGAANAARVKIKVGSVLEKVVMGKIRIEKWSPEQVSGWLKATGREYVCPNTVYDWIYTERRELLAELHCPQGQVPADESQRSQKGGRLKPRRERLSGTGREIRWSAPGVPVT